MSEERISQDIPTALIDAITKSGGQLEKDCWLHKQSGKYVVKHYALERVAAHMNITFDPPVMIESNVDGKGAVVCVTGQLGDKTEWSIGEAAPYNNQMNYPYAMAEKRAKDRVILKLLNVHGEVYSQEEADDFDDKAPAMAERIKSLETHVERLKRYVKAVYEYQPSVAAVKEGIALNNISEAAEEWFTLTKDAQRSLWLAPTLGGLFTTTERETMKSTEFKEAHFGANNE